MYLKPSTFVFTKLYAIFAKPFYCDTFNEDKRKDRLARRFLKEKKTKLHG